MRLTGAPAPHCLPRVTPNAYSRFERQQRPWGSSIQLKRPVWEKVLLIEPKGPQNAPDLRIIDSCLSDLIQLEASVTSGLSDGDDSRLVLPSFLPSSLFLFLLLGFRG